MKCPTCGAWTIVMESRHGTRRRECANLHRFTTQENVVTTGRSASTKRKTESMKTMPPDVKQTLSQRRGQPFGEAA